METRGNRPLEWRFNMVETLGFGFSLAAVAVSITLWAVTTFQTQKDAEGVRETLVKRIESVEVQMAQVRAGVDSVAKDVSYIRGRIEPREH